jgi:ferredoxin--NADP+ reductase
MSSSEYNARVIGKILVTPDLMILRVETDEPREGFEAGQYTVLGLYGREGRSSNSTAEMDPADPDELIRRPYSISSAITETRQLEFYITQVKSGQLTPRLFNLELGSRLYIGKRITGVFKLDETPPGKDIVMIATGTGVAPYISFIRSHLTERPDSRMVIIQGAAKQWDLGYYSELSFLDRNFANFTYLPTLPEEDEHWDGYRLWIDEMLEADIIREEADIQVDPDRTHFFLCGNPKMIEIVSAWLYDLGYVKHSRRDPGSLHVEEFWK